MPREGFYWSTDPKVIAQKFSAWADNLDGELGNIVSESLDAAVESMRNTVLTSGVHNGEKTGTARLQSGDMFNSIAAEQSASRGRAVGRFGFIHNVPYYTIFQEYGTYGRRAGGMGETGIRPMLAFATAQNLLVTDLHNRVSNHDWTKGF